MQLLIRKGWRITFDEQHFQVVGYETGENCQRLYKLRSRDGHEATIRRDRLVGLSKDGRLQVTTAGEARLMKNMGKISLVRDYAERGHSKSYTAKQLGLYSRDLDRLIELSGARDIQFVKGTESIAFKDGLKKVHEARRGSANPDQPPEVYAALARGRETLRQRYLHTAFGITGTVRELKERFRSLVSVQLIRMRLTVGGMTIEEALTSPVAPNEYRALALQVRKPEISEKQLGVALNYSASGLTLVRTAQRLGVSRGWLADQLEITDSGIRFESQKKTYNALGCTGTIPDLLRLLNIPLAPKTVRYRLSRGMSIEEALTRAPFRPERGVLPPQFVAQVEKDRRQRRGCVMDAIQRRLTPTMLQYRSTEHNIVVTRRDTSHITVEVSTKTGEIVQELRFTETFNSGILFAYSSTEQGELDFLAFESDSPALLTS